MGGGGGIGRVGVVQLPVCLTDQSRTIGLSDGRQRRRRFRTPAMFSGSQLALNSCRDVTVASDRSGVMRSRACSVQHVQHVEKCAERAGKREL